MNTRRPASSANLPRAIRACALAAVCALIFLPYFCAPANHTAAVAQPKGGRVTPTPTPRATPRKTPTRTPIKPARPASSPTPRPTPRVSPSPTPNPTPSPTPRPQTPARTPQPAPTPARLLYNEQARMELVWVPPGSFVSARPARPGLTTTITEGFYMGRYEVTQAQWRLVMGSKPASYPGDQWPVERVTLEEAEQFVSRLNAANRDRTLFYRLPSEPEWEYAARAGRPEVRAADLAAVAWYNANSGGHSHEVGQKLPNAFGLHDMLGNVWEWCRDGGVVMPQGHSVYPARGGSWDSPAAGAASTSRLLNNRQYGRSDIGFRVVAQKVR